MTEDTRETLLSALAWALILLVFFGSLSKARFPFFWAESTENPSKCGSL